MKQLRLENYYGSGDGPIIDDDYHYLLFRQDWGGSESLYFNFNDLDEVLKKIDYGDVLVHMNYSILYCATIEHLKLINEKFYCYKTLYK